MKIGIDIDNVITNTFEELSHYFNRFMRKEFTPPEAIEAMRKEKLKMVGYWFLTWRRGLLTQVKPIEGARETIGLLHAKHRIALITSRMPVFNRQTKLWLSRHDVPYHELHHAKEKHKYKKAGGCRYFIEDNLEEAEVLADHCEKIFLFDYPWNRRTTRDNIIRVNGWRDIEALVNAG